MDTARIQDTAEMDRDTIAGIHEVAARLERRIESIVCAETRDRYEDATQALMLVCREARDR